MDLRDALKTDAERKEAARLLDYQPFIISDDIQTGAAYSWMNGGDPRVRPQLLFHRHEETEESWTKISDANGRLATMYDDFVAAIAERYPGGSLLDLACNNGYLPVRADTLGMRPSLGIDGEAKHGSAIGFLNRVLGARAKFKARFYDSNGRRVTGYVRRWRTSLIPNLPRCDVVCLLAILCHLPDPLGFLAYAGSRAKEAMFFMGQVVDSEHFLVSYQRPHAALSETQSFPFAFNDNTRLSRGLLWHAFEQMGFCNIIEFPWKAEWLPQRFGQATIEPNEPNARLGFELQYGSRHIAVLAMRP